LTRYFAILSARGPGDREQFSVCSIFSPASRLITIYF